MISAIASKCLPRLFCFLLDDIYCGNGSVVIEFVDSVV